MKIKAVEFWPVEMKLAEPYKIAYESIDKSVNIFCRIITDKNITGYGCAAPDEKVTGEDAVSVMQTCQNMVEPLLINQDPLRIAFILEQLKKNIVDQPSVFSMVDMALFDILGKTAGLPVYLLIGGFRKSIMTSVTIGIGSTSQAVYKAAEYKRMGFKAIKIKGGIDVEQDVERVLKVREAIGKQIELRFDANQGYSVEDTILFIEQTKSAKLELMEQPTPRDKYDLLGQVTNKVMLPIMADESLMNLRDAFRLAKGNFADMANIKLMKVGGISEALQINSVARAAGLEVMVGCMDECALGIAAGLHFALARPNVLYADLDGHLDLIDDPSNGAVQLKSGVLYPNQIPGLGWME